MLGGLELSLYISSIRDTVAMKELRAYDSCPKKGSPVTRIIFEIRNTRRIVAPE